MAIAEFTALKPEAVAAELVYTGADNEQNHILYGYFTSGDWHQIDAPLYSAPNTILTPFLTTDADGSKFLIWSEARGSGRYVLRSMRGQVTLKDSAPRIQWDSPTLLATTRDYNLGAIAVRDAANKMWVFWTSDDGEDSDIFEIQRRQNGWSDPQLSHPDNNQPDLGASASLLANGELELTWKRYNPDSFSYDDQRRVRGALSADERRQFQQQLSQQSTQHSETPATNIKLPDFVPNSQLIRVHLPGNTTTPFFNLNLDSKNAPPQN